MDVRVGLWRRLSTEELMLLNCGVEEDSESWWWTGRPGVLRFMGSQRVRHDWATSLSLFTSKEHPGLISFRMDWLDLLAVQGTLKSLLQHHSSKASILWHSAFFIVQLSHPYTTTGKTIALTRWTFVEKVMSLLFYMLSMLVITFLPRSKHLLISWLQSPSAVILEARKIKSATISTVSHLFAMK